MAASSLAVAKPTVRSDGQPPRRKYPMIAGIIARMKGINASTGKALEGIQHLRQSITDILTTPIGTRVMRRAYGSNLPRLVDAPMNHTTLLDLYAATVEAIDLWEPRFSLQSVKATSAEPGRVVLSMTGEYLPDGEIITLDGIVVT